MTCRSRLRPTAPIHPRLPLLALLAVLGAVTLTPVLNLVLATTAGLDERMARSSRATSCSSR